MVSVGFLTCLKRGNSLACHNYNNNRRAADDYKSKRDKAAEEYGRKGAENQNCPKEIPTKTLEPLSRCCRRSSQSFR